MYNIFCSTYYVFIVYKPKSTVTLCRSEILQTGGSVCKAARSSRTRAIVPKSEIHILISEYPYSIRNAVILALSQNLDLIPDREATLGKRETLFYTRSRIQESEFGQLWLRFAVRNLAANGLTIM